MLRQLLIPGDPEVTMQALELFAADLQEGAAFSEALETFCRCVLTGV